MKKYILMIVMALFAGILAVSAQDSIDDQGDVNDPNDNNRANACYEGGTLEGKCDTELMWQAGWYLIRYENDLLDRTEIPVWVNWVLPPEIAPDPVAAASAPAGNGCYTNGSRSFRFDNSRLNTDISAISTFSGVNCDGGGIVTFSNLITNNDVSDEMSIITASGTANALTRCQNMFNEPGTSNHSVHSVAGLGYNTPASWYVCVADTGPIL